MAKFAADRGCSLCAKRQAKQEAKAAAAAAARPEAAAKPVVDAMEGDAGAAACVAEAAELPPMFETAPSGGDLPDPGVDEDWKSLGLGTEDWERLLFFLQQAPDHKAQKQKQGG